MISSERDRALVGAKLVRADLRLALAQADELLKRAETVLKRSFPQRHD